MQFNETKDQHDQLVKLSDYNKPQNPDFE